jgi:hypothetical protein
MRFPCPACQTPLSAPDDDASGSTVCPRCRQPVPVPDPLATPTDPLPRFAPSRGVAAAAIALVLLVVGAVGVLAVQRHLLARSAAAEEEFRRPIPAGTPKPPGGGLE